MEPTFLQTYWWIVISILGGLLVFLLFVQGGQTLFLTNSNKQSQALMVTSLGRKWELTFTTLVVFGGAFFAAFPLFYSTSFGGAYWLWMLILFSFVVQAVSYEFRTRKGNLFSTRTYDICLVFNGLFGCVLLGVAVGMMFFGGHFTIVKTNILDTASPVISQWAPSHGIEAIFNWRNLLLGFTVFFLARTLGALYFINNIRDQKDFGVTMRTQTLINGTIFALLFVSFVIVLMLSPGLRMTYSGFVLEPNCYWHNLLAMWWLIPVLLLAVIAVLYGIYRTAFSSTFTKGIWYAGVGTVVVVIILFWLAGFNDTAYYPSITDTDSSLTIVNSSSTPFTLTAMSYASLIIPVVLFYIVYVWKKMNSRPITPADLNQHD
ncbi:MAG: cytochrome d ubiquinol oxidase subunit II [Muribaculaceae bacterium]|nr:cytochrome d ubiquinol oxidase subunit II [Muribaculaceae bacterium]